MRAVQGRFLRLVRTTSSNSPPNATQFTQSVTLIRLRRCMAYCGDSAQTHQHVKACAFSMHPGAKHPNPSHSFFRARFISSAVITAFVSGSYHGKISEFNEVHRKRRSEALAAYLQGIPDAILRAAVILFLIIQRMLLHVLIVELRRFFSQITKAMAKDLQDLNIVLSI